MVKDGLISQHQQQHPFFTIIQNVEKSYLGVTYGILIDIFRYINMLVVRNL